MASYVAYYRVSTARQGRSGLGLEAQRQAVEAFIGKAPDHEFTEVESGKRSDRPELLKALDLAELTGSILIVAKLDRLSRDAGFLLALQNSGAKILFADMPDADRLVIGVMAMLAEWERGQISKRTKEALAVAKQKGRKIGGNDCSPDDENPIKYRGAANLERVRSLGTAQSAKRRSEAAKLRAAKVRPHIEAARASGATSTRQIAAFLNSKGIQTSRGGEWRAGSVQRLLATI